MKKTFLRRAFLFCLGAAISVLVFTGCAVNGDTEKTDIKESAGDVEKINEEDTPYSLHAKESEIAFEVRENRLFVVSLSDASGENVIQASEYPLPMGIFINGEEKTPDWKFVDAVLKTEADNGIERNVSVFSFHDDIVGLTYKIYCAARSSLEGPFEFYSELVNESGADFVYKTGEFFNVKAVASEKEPTVFRIKKESYIADGLKLRASFQEPDTNDLYLYQGSGLYNQKLSEEQYCVAWNNADENTEGKAFIPMIYLDYSGERGIYIALEYSVGRVKVGSFSGIVNLASDIDVAEQSGVIFETTVRENTTFLIPSVYFGTYTGDLDDGSNIFKKWFLGCKSPEIVRENENEPLTQCDAQFSAETAVSLNVESVKWDYNWWGGEAAPNMKTNEGSWCVKTGELLETGLDFENSGLNWAVYTLLHDSVDSEGNAVDIGEFNSVKHPEWFSNRKLTSGASADLGNEECVEYLKTALLEFFTSNHIHTWRTDFEPVCLYSDKENRHFANGNDVQYWATKGFIDIIDYLYENYDDFRYESCSSGGGMKDLLTATKAVVINCDDFANYLSLRTTFYDSSYCFCPAQLQLPCNPDTFCTDSSYYCQPIYDDELYRDAVKDMGFRSMMLGGMMFGTWTGGWDTLSYDLNSWYAKYFKLYEEKVRPLVRNANLYHILPRPDGINWDGVMYFDPDTENEIKGAAFIFKPSEDIGETTIIKMRGLDYDKMYKISYEDYTDETFILSGEDLCENGIFVTICGVGSEIVWITEAGENETNEPWIKPLPLATT